MQREYIQRLYEYSTWANEHILDTTAQLTREQFLMSVVPELPCVRDILVHTMSAQWLWLSRWQGLSPKSMHQPQEFDTLESIRSHWRAIEEETRSFVSQLTASELSQVIEYVTTEGSPNAYPLWQLMVHQVNHATQHRSEVAVLLTQFGYSPGWLDFIYWLDLKKALR